MNILKNKSGKTLNLLLSVIALFIIILAIVLVASKGFKGNSAYDETFKSNLANMQEVAKEHFADNPPSEIGGSKIVTLEEMYDLGLIDEEFKYGKTKCDTENSYILITKLNEDQYKVKSNLVCGNKSDILYEKIKASTFVIDKDGNVKTDNVKVLDDNYNKNDDDAQGETKGGVVTDKDGKYSDSATECMTVGCTIEKVETDCKGVFEYEHVRKEAYCPAGYNAQNGLCIKSITDVIDATTTSNSYTAVYSAKIRTDESVEYTNPIITTTEGEKVCPTGYTANGDRCEKYVNAKEKTTTTTSCPSGWTKKNGKCYKAAKTSYTSWGNPINHYTTTVRESEIVRELYKKVLINTQVRNGVTWYTYAEYKRSKTYSCSGIGGTLSGTQCVRNVITNTNTTYSCTEGKLVGKKCLLTKDYIITDGTTHYSCPEGFTATGEGKNLKCYRTVTGDGIYYCENANARLIGDKCYIDYTGDETTSCAWGYTLGTDGRCYKYSTTSTHMLYRIIEYKYSSEKYIPGFVRTGHGTFTYTCTPIRNIIK